MNEEERLAAGIAILPVDLHEALECLKASQVMKKALGPHIFDKYLEGKEREWDEYARKQNPPSTTNFAVTTIKFTPPTSARP